MDNWNHTYLGLGIGHGHTDDGMTGVVTKEGKHFHTFRGETAHTDAWRMANDMHAKARRALPDNMVDSGGKHIYDDVQHQGSWYRRLTGDENYTRMGD